MARSLLDASALLALVQNEPGADPVREASRGDAAMSVVNLAEVAASLHQSGWPGQDVAITTRGFGIEFLPLDAETALRSGALRPPTRDLGLGVG